MSLSSVSVIANALRLRGVRLDDDADASREPKPAAGTTPAANVGGHAHHAA